VSVVEVERSAEALSALGGAVVVDGRGDEKAIVDALMISLTFVVLDKLAESAAQVSFAKRNDSAEALLPDRAHPTFRVGVEIRASGWKLDGLYARSLQDGDELPGEHGEWWLCDVEAVDGVADQ
jgi:hypothetical protein